MPLVRPFRTSFGVETDRDALLVRVRTPEGDGWGECVAMGEPGYSSEYVESAQHVLRKHLVPPVLAAGDVGAGDVAQLLSGVQGHRMAKAALEMAVLDIRASRRRSVLRRRARRGQGIRRVWCEHRHPGVDRRTDRTGRRLSGRGLPAHQAQDRTGLGRRARRRGAQRLRRRTAAAGRRQRRVPSRRRRAPRQARSVQPFADRAAPCRRTTSSATPVSPRRSARRSASTSRSARCATPSSPSSSAPAKSINIKAGRVGGYLEAVALHDLCHAVGHPRVVRRACWKPASAAPPTSRSRRCPASRCRATRARRIATSAATSPSRS